jgi:hypothetical protein
MLKVFCVMLSGAALSTVVSNKLFSTAVEMYRKDVKKQSIKENGLEGRVRTDFQHVAMGSISGVRFFADVESEKGKTSIEYLVRIRDLTEEITEEFLSKGFWVSLNSKMARSAPLN